MGSCFSRKVPKSQTGEIKKIEMEEYSGWFDLPYDMRRMIIDLLDLEAKAKFSKCSEYCYEEVMESRNYVDEIQIFYDFNSKYKNIVISVNAKIEGRWLFGILPLTNGNVVVVWKYSRFSDRELVSTKTFENKTSNEVIAIYFNDFLMKNKRSLETIEILINSFPYDQTNIRGLSNTNLKTLILFENHNGIDPISSGFVDFDTICRFQDTVEIPNYQLDYFFNIKARDRELGNPKYSLEDFDNFLRRCLVEEELDENFGDIRIGCQKMGKSLNDLTQVIEKYTETLTETGCHFRLFQRESKKWNNLNYSILLDKFKFNLCFTYKITRF